MTDFYLKSKSKVALEDVVKGIADRTEIKQGSIFTDPETQIVTMNGDPDYWYVAARLGLAGVELPEGVEQCDIVEGSQVVGVFA